MAFPSEESKLISGPAFKACAKKFVLRNKARAATRKDRHFGGESRFRSWFTWLVWCIGRAAMSQGWFVESTDVGSISVRNSGTKDHLLEILLTSHTSGKGEWLCIRRWSIRE
jgi:hypothetical protein